MGEMVQLADHVYRWRRWRVGTDCVRRLIGALPPDGPLTSSDAVAWLRAMEASLRIAYDVSGSINIFEAE